MMAGVRDGLCSGEMEDFPDCTCCIATHQQMPSSKWVEAPDWGTVIGNEGQGPPTGTCLA
jgi:hypothetical protein